MILTSTSVRSEDAIESNVPDAFIPGYILYNPSISPDENYGVIYAKSDIVDEELEQNFLIALKPFRILGTNEGFSYFESANQRELQVQWTKDSSVALVMVGGKWGTIGATLFELHEGSITRQTNLMVAINRLLEPSFQNSKAAPYNDSSHFILDEEKEWKLIEDDKQLYIDVAACNAPNLDPGKLWRGHLRAVWSIVESKWLTQKITSSVEISNP